MVIWSVVPFAVLSTEHDIPRSDQRSVKMRGYFKQFTKYLCPVLHATSTVLGTGRLYGEKLRRHNSTPTVLSY